MVTKIISIAKEAGNIIREGFGKNVAIEWKTDATNIVTEIDKRAEEIIINFISKEFPGHSILAEESGRKDGRSEYRWVIDPLDGTTNFAHGLPIFAVSIGLQKNDEIIAGVIYDVMNDVAYSAELGSGAFANWRKISVNQNSVLLESLLVTGFPYDIAENPDKTVEKFNAFLGKSRAVRRLGSAAIDLCYVAKGVFEGFWEVNLSPWDICAGILLVQEAGGLVTDFQNNPVDIFSNQILATNGNVHKKMLDILQKNS